MKIVSVSQMQKAERDCAQYGISLDQLMENAGRAVAEEIRETIGALPEQNILILVGPGNNGGDGLVAARYLHDWKARKVMIMLCGSRPEGDPNLRAAIRGSVLIRQLTGDSEFAILEQWLEEATVVLDAIFGTGKSRPLSGIYARVLESVRIARDRRPDQQLIALDLPSGLDADTGAVDPATPFFDRTITLGFPKAGLFNLPGAERAGNITVVDIGIPQQVADYVNTELLTAEWAGRTLPKRPLISHKGTYGKILSLVGSVNYIGAAYLSCAGSIRTGAGLSTLAIADSLLPVLAAKLTEVTFLPLPSSGGILLSNEAVDIIQQQLPKYEVLLIGCGIGQSPAVQAVVKELLFEPREKPPRVVLDADGLAVLLNTSEWWKAWKDEAVLTPHAGEMSRLLGKPIEEIQANRAETAREAAAKWNKIVVLKGAYTVIASPGGQVCISPFANPGLASAGTGDVLAGVISGMLAQGLSPFDAASCGVFLHGLAGEMVRSEMGDAGMLASDLLPVLPKAIRQLKCI